jgi:CMP-N-acetylneuraminic acid synthetase
MKKAFNGCCIIPCRRGSKRIPGKNLKKLNGKPLLSYILNTALASNCFNLFGVHVASDDPDALQLAAEMGAVPFEIPSEMAQDQSPVTPVLSKCLQNIPKNQSTVPPQVPAFACYLRATSPFVRTETIKRAVESLNMSPLDTDAKGQIVDSVVSVHHVTGAHPSRFKCIDPVTGLLVDAYSEYKEGLEPRSSSSLVALHRSSCVTVVRREILLGSDPSVAHPSMWGNRIKPLVVEDEKECIDINTPLEFDFAEYLCHQAGPHSPLKEGTCFMK